MKRQKVRKLLLLIALLLFPVTIYYFSPYLIIQAALEGIISGSFIVFGLMLILSLFLGRSFCGYICPAGGIQEASFGFNDKAAKLGRRKYIKYVIWGIWIVSIGICFWIYGGIEKVDILYMTEYGVSITEAPAYILYYSIVCILMVPGLICGKRSFCHYFCWMTPFMVIGTKIRNKLRLPGLHITTYPSKCIGCKQCNKNCPMSLDVVSMVKGGKCDDAECILCGACVDTCPKKALQYKMKNDKHNTINES